MSAPLPPSWQGLEQRYGPVPHQDHILRVGGDFLSFIAHGAGRRAGEVVLVVCRPDGHVLLHTKPFYPPDTWRLPSGGCRPGEAPEAAAQREMAEETGLPGRLERLLGLLTYRFEGPGATVAFASAVFLAETPPVEPVLHDPEERISGYRWVRPEDLAEVGRRLRRLPAGWRDWGEWRALAHFLAARQLSSA